MTKKYITPGGNKLFLYIMQTLYNIYFTMKRNITIISIISFQIRLKILKENI